MLKRQAMWQSGLGLLFALLSIVLLVQQSHAFDPCTVEDTDCEESNAGAVPTGECEPVDPVCLQDRVWGEQDARPDYKNDTIQAVANDLPSDTIAFPAINQGIPPTLVPVSPSQPIPSLILRGILWQESRWLQFAETVYDPDDRNACTLVSPDCGYGMVQLTSCMSSDPNGGCSITSIDRGRVAGDVSYNLSGGMHTLIGKWNDVVPFIGDNNHTDPNQWHYAVTAYNGWSPCNNPNLRANWNTCKGAEFDPLREPYDVNDVENVAYPYQEKVFGSLANPRPALEPDVVAFKLWRPTHIPAIPRGIWGIDGDNWQPPTNTPRPVMHLLHDVRSNGDSSSTIIFTNPTDELLAADIVFYNDDHKFNRWGFPEDESYFRVEAGQTRSIALDTIFSAGSNFNGYARINASEGLEIEVVNPVPTSYQLFLPIVQRDTVSQPDCDTWFTEGFEFFTANGQLLNWDIYANDRHFATDGTNVYAYSLADGTWFRNGNSGGYLGGYPGGSTELKSELINVPSTYQDAFYLQFAWYVRSTNPTTETEANLRLYVEDSAGRREIEEGFRTNLEAGTGWRESRFNIRWADINPGENFSIIFTSYNSEMDAGRTQFFVDDVQLEVCR